MAERLATNTEIRAKEVRLIGPEGKQVGIVPLKIAIDAAKALELDLVEVAPNASPPVAKVMDYGKHLYEQERAEREARKQQRGGGQKAMRLRPKIDDHDFDTKVRQAHKLPRGGPLGAGADHVPPPRAAPSGDGHQAARPLRRGAVGHRTGRDTLADGGTLHHDGARSARSARLTPGSAVALNADRVGHRYPAYRFEVGREHVRAFASVTGSTDRRYHDEAPDSDADGLAVPPAYVACITGAQAWSRVIADPELGAHDRVMHGGQEFEFSAPVRVGDVLVCTPAIADLRAFRDMELLTLEVTCARPDGSPVVVSRSRLIFVGETAESGSAETRPGVAVEPGSAETRPGVAVEPGSAETRPGVAVEPGSAETRPGVAVEPGSAETHE